MADRQHFNARRLFRERIRAEQGPARGGGFQGLGRGGGLFQGQLQPYRPPAALLFEHRPETMKALQKQLKSLRDEPLEGFRLIIDENNLFHWTIAMFGPPDTPYAGGYFKAKLRFPMFYPAYPPEMIFTPPLYHPNIYPDGKVCLSFLHPPGDDPRSGEKADQRWKPDRDIRQILLAVIALLSQPNADSPANVDAAVNYRQYQNTGSKDYLNRIMRDVENSKAEAIKDNVVVPLTREDYLATGADGAKKKEEEAQEEKEAETAAEKKKTSVKKKSSAKKKAPAKKKEQANNGTAPDNPDSDDADEDDNSEASTGDDDDDSDETYDPDTDEARESELDDAVD